MKDRSTPDERLTPEQFRALLVWKGWTHQQVAIRWDVTRAWVTKIASNPDRPARYDDAVRGLPNKKTQNRDWAALRRRLEGLIGVQSVKEPAEAPVRVTGDYRYHGYITVGSILTASADIGDMAELGTRGIAFQVRDTGAGEIYGVIFETGLWDWFSPHHVDQYLASTGLTDIGMEGYVYQDEIQLQAAFEAEQMSFWPMLP
ncbi:hypothetical protein ACTOWA_00750 [Herbaspirillum seropedicae]|uniref:hypothetical protein n=1 Tax=Herbaspirillum seropedicae TaxID=964 RepID=UPI00286289E9|nr:hypothetical protein [Herbaspirillum seropedicae]MDR6398051.1 hypothetical protein [Herbaspirillum seropedicae]